MEVRRANTEANNAAGAPKDATAFAFVYTQGGKFGSEVSVWGLEFRVSSLWFLVNTRSRLCLITA